MPILFRHATEHPPNLRKAKCCLYCKHSWFDQSTGCWRCKKFHEAEYPVDMLYVCDEFEWEQKEADAYED